MSRARARRRRLTFAAFVAFLGRRLRILNTNARARNEIRVSGKQMLRYDFGVRYYF